MSSQPFTTCVGVTPSSDTPADLARPARTGLQRPSRPSDPDPGDGDRALRLTARATPLPSLGLGAYGGRHSSSCIGGDG